MFINNPHLPTGGGFAPSHGAFQPSAGDVVHASHGADDEAAYAEYASALGLPVVPPVAADADPLTAIAARVTADVRAALGQPSGTPVSAVTTDEDADYAAAAAALGIDVDPDVR